MTPGDEAAFERWYPTVHARLVATLALTTGDLDEAAEAADEAMLRAFEQWDRVSAMASPDGWTFRVALNVHRRRGRRRLTEDRLLRRHRPNEAATLPEPAIEAWEAMKGLPLRQRQMVALRFVGDFTEPQIAEALGVSRGTVASTLSDARRRLGQLLHEDDPPDTPDGPAPAPADEPEEAR